MGKRKGRKKKKKQLKYRKTQFIDILCNGCEICGDYVEPEFCFGLCYKSNPRAFLDHSYRMLCKRKEWPFCTGAIGDSRTLKNEVLLFEEVFCKSGCCEPEYVGNCREHPFPTTLPEMKLCRYMNDCMQMFQLQVSDSRSEEVAEERNHTPSSSRKAKNKKKRKRKQKNRKVVEVYPTFLSSDRDDFKKEIHRILYGPNNHKQTGNAQSS